MPRPPRIELNPSMTEFCNSCRLPGILGNKAARRLVENKTGYQHAWYPKDRIDLDMIVSKVSELFKVAPEKIRLCGTGKPNPWRSMAMHVAQVKGRYSTNEIAEWMNIKCL